MKDDNGAPKNVNEQAALANRGHRQYNGTNYHYLQSPAFCNGCNQSSSLTMFCLNNLPQNKFKGNKPVSVRCHGVVEHKVQELSQKFSQVSMKVLVPFQNVAFSLAACHK